LSKFGNSIPSIKDFKFLKVLGKGGFATVYMVRHNPTGKLYAMKCVKKPLSPQKAEQVQSERNILAQLNNPFIV
jgi:serine/threonine protein kinase